jgi:hypothetical protein
VIIDDGGADDETGQKDLNQVVLDEANYPDSIEVSWNWDDTARTGNNTSDACSLFDTDADGKANFAVCVIAGGDPLSYQETVVYSCGDDQSDRCTSPVAVIPDPATTCSAALVANSDPFGVVGSPYYDADHVTGNTCNATDECYTDDLVASCTIALSDFGGGNPQLLNVCAYPSSQPNSDPAECIVTPGAGFLTIVKVADPNDGTAFEFNASEAATNGVSSWTINGSGSVQLIPYLETTTLDLSEVVPANWELDSAACMINGETTGTFDAALDPATITDIEIRAGLETTCTFNNTGATGNIIVRKVANPVGTTAVFPFDPSWSDTNFNLSEGSPPFMMSKGSGPLPAGTYTVSELVPSNWKLTDLVCADPDNGSEVDFTTATATVDLDANETVTCTFTDTKNGRIKIVKEIPIKNYTGTQKFEFDPSWSETNFFLGKSQVYDTNYTLAPGVYSVAEVNIPAGWRLDKSSCNDGSPVDAINLSAGETVICKFANLPQ